MERADERRHGGGGGLPQPVGYGDYLGLDPRQKFTRADFDRPREDDLGRAIAYTIHHVRAQVLVGAEDGGPTEVIFRRPGGEHRVIVRSGLLHREEWGELNQAHFPGERLRVNREALDVVTLSSLIELRRHHLEHQHTCLRWSLADDQFHEIVADEDFRAHVLLAGATDRQLLGLPLEVRRPGDLDGVSWLEWSVA